MPRAGESDMGVFSLQPGPRLEHLPIYAREATPGAGTGERNFLPFITWMAARGDRHDLRLHGPREALGINTPDDLATVAAYLASR